MKNNKFLNIFKWIWLAIVILGASWYTVTNFSSIKEYFISIQPVKLIFSCLLLFLGKIITTDLTYQSLLMVNHEIEFKQTFSIATITQLGKYLPGGIWHFAGKFGVYKSRGMKTKEAMKPMILENLWLFSSAFVTGILGLLISKSQDFCNIFDFICEPKYNFLFLIGIPLIWMLSLIFLPKFLFGINAKFPFHLRVIIEQISIWILFGISLWMIFPEYGNTNLLLLTISAFSISWLAGYAAVFAPGGIGVREAVLTLILGSLFTGEMIAIYVSIHRLLWVFIEILLGLGSALLFGMPFSKKPNIE